MEDSTGHKTDEPNHPDKPFWLEWEFYTAAGTIILAVGTIFLVVKTDKLVSSAEEASKKQLRAYISVEIVGIENAVAGAQPKAIARIKNHGQTPAYKVSSSNKIFFADINIDKTINIPEKKDVNRVSLTIGPGAEVAVNSIADFSLIASGISALQDKTGIIFYMGCIVYEDVFGETRQTIFTHAYFGQPLVGQYHDFGNNAD